MIQDSLLPQDCSLYYVAGRTAPATSYSCCSMLPRQASHHYRIQVFEVFLILVDIYCLICYLYTLSIFIPVWNGWTYIVVMLPFLSGICTTTSLLASRSLSFHWLLLTSGFSVSYYIGRLSKGSNKIYYLTLKDILAAFLSKLIVSSGSIICSNSQQKITGQFLVAMLINSFYVIGLLSLLAIVLFLKAIKLRKTMYLSRNELICAICLQRVQSLKEYIQLDCSHEFHRECLQAWQRVSSSCAICRSKIGT